MTKALTIEIVKQRIFFVVVVVSLHPEQLCFEAVVGKGEDLGNLPVSALYHENSVEESVIPLVVLSEVTRHHSSIVLVTERIQYLLNQWFLWKVPMNHYYHYYRAQLLLLEE